MTVAESQCPTFVCGGQGDALAMEPGQALQNTRACGRTHLLRGARSIPRRNRRATCAGQSSRISSRRNAVMVRGGFFVHYEDMAPKSLHVRIHEVVSRIPRGRVATYGQVARLAGLPGQARLVGYALHALPAGTSVPWQRVVNAQGAISTPGGPDNRQRRLLESEGVRFDDRGRIALIVRFLKRRC